MLCEVSKEGVLSGGAQSARSLARGRTLVQLRRTSTPCAGTHLGGLRLAAQTECTERSGAFLFHTPRTMQVSQGGAASLLSRLIAPCQA